MKYDINPNQFTKVFPYTFLIEIQMKTFYSLLSEKDRRLYAATEALKLGYGGISHISAVLGCDRKTINRGIQELSQPELIVKDGIGKKGGGRKSGLENIPDIDVKFLQVLSDNTAGDPMDENIRWTHLTHQLIAD